MLLARSMLYFTKFGGLFFLNSVCLAALHQGQVKLPMTLTSSSRNSQCALIQQQLLNLILTKIFFNYFVEQPMLVAEFLIASLALMQQLVIAIIQRMSISYFFVFS